MHGLLPRGRTAATSLLSLVLLAAASTAAAQRTVARITGDAGGHERIDVPVTAVLTGVPLHLADGQLRLYETTGGRDAPVASQLRPGAPDELAWILSGRTAAGAKRSFELRSVPDAPPAAAAERAVRVGDDGDALRVTLGGRPVLEYRYTPMPVPEGVKPVFSSSAFIHPLWSPGGEVLTRIQPPDHRHHYGIENPWTHTEFQGRSVDFWNLGSGQGRVRAAAVLERVDGDVLGGFHTLHEHVDQTAPGGDRVALDEQWKVTVWNVPGRRKAWLIDFVSTMNPATDSAFTIKAYRYQGFSLRATPKWNDSTATILTSEGKNKSDANSTRARWLEVNGVAAVPEGRAGILFMSNPSNFNFPEPLRIWPTGTNGGKENVYVNFNPAQDRDWVLRPGHSYVLKYRMLVHDGVVGAAEAERLWTDFADPPRVEVEPVGDAAE
jgi:hypothetical protein